MSSDSFVFTGENLNDYLKAVAKNIKDGRKSYAS